MRDLEVDGKTELILAKQGLKTWSELMCAREFNGWLLRHLQFQLENHKERGMFPRG
jgi:hypothetical protein